jgi:iron complex outermembrane receptor protein
MLATQYNLPLNKAKETSFVFRGEWKYLGEQYFDLTNTIRQSPYNLFNTRTGLSTKYTEVMLWLRNIGNRKYISYAYDFGAVHLGEPFTWGVTFSTRFR